MDSDLFPVNSLHLYRFVRESHFPRTSRVLTTELRWELRSSYFSGRKGWKIVIFYSSFATNTEATNVSLKTITGNNFSPLPGPLIFDSSNLFTGRPLNVAPLIGVSCRSRTSLTGDKNPANTILSPREQLVIAIVSDRLWRAYHQLACR